MNDIAAHDAIVVGAGQSGLAAARALQSRGLEPIVLEAGGEPVGSWPNYYDSLTLFSPARYSGLPGVTFSGDPEHYPTREEVVAYLRGYAKQLDADIRTTTRVAAMRYRDGVHTVATDNGSELTAELVIAATGGFGRPFIPTLPGRDDFTGQVMHAGHYREPSAFAGQRVVVVGAGNSAVQIAVELAGTADVTLATRNPVKYVPQRPFGKDMHFWLTVTGIDTVPVGPWLRHPPTAPVFDTGIYRGAVRSGRPGRRPMFTHLHDDTVVWADGSHEHVDTVLMATGYNPDMDYLRPIGALDATGVPQHRHGLSTTHPGLGYVGLEWQRSLSSASLRGVGRDAAHVVNALLAKRTRP